MAYAEDTTVPFDKSISQLVRLIKNSKADRVAHLRCEQVATNEIIGSALARLNTAI